MEAHHIYKMSLLQNPCLRFQNLTFQPNSPWRWTIYMPMNEIILVLYYSTTIAIHDVANLYLLAPPNCNLDFTSFRKIAVYYAAFPYLCLPIVIWTLCRSTKARFFTERTHTCATQLQVLSLKMKTKPITECG